MVPGVRTSDPRQRVPFFDVHPHTGATIEVFYADRALETFGRGGAGWFGGPAGAAVRQTVLLVRLPLAAQRIEMRW
jgi:hypothetical protein